MYRKVLELVCVLQNIRRIGTRLQGFQGWHAPRAFKMAGAIGKQGGRGSNLFRTPESGVYLQSACPAVVLLSSGGTIVSGRGSGCRAFVLQAEVCSTSRECDEDGVFTSMFCICIEHDSSLGVIRRARLRARARRIIIASRNCCDIATCLCVILQYYNAISLVRRKGKERESEGKRKETSRRCRAAL